MRFFAIHASLRYSIFRNEHHPSGFQRAACRKAYHTLMPHQGAKPLKNRHYSLTFGGVLSAGFADGGSIFVNTGSDQGPVTE